MLAPSRTAESPSANLWVPPGRVMTGYEQSALFTTGVGACIEVAVHDSSKRIGHMAHIFSTIGSQQTAFSELEVALRLHGADPLQLSAWMTGGSSEASMSAEAPLRTQAALRLAELGLHPDSNLSVDWNDDESLLVAASLDCGTGTHSVSYRPITAPQI